MNNPFTNRNRLGYFGNEYSKNTNPALNVLLRNNPLKISRFHLRKRLWVAAYESIYEK